MNWPSESGDATLLAADSVERARPRCSQTSGSASADSLGPKRVANRGTQDALVTQYRLIITLTTGRIFNIYYIVESCA